MKILGIETSCDETAMSVLQIDENRIEVLSNAVSSQIKLHSKFGGVVPSLAAREHAKNIDKVFKLALKIAKINDFKEIDLLAVTNGPGLGPALLIGLSYAKTLAWKFDKQIIGVNHLDGHIHSNWLLPTGEISEIKDSEIFPALNLIVSGGHTELVLMRTHGDYEIIGETLDDAVGEAFDKVARLLNLGYPGGPIISKLADDGNPLKYPLPSPMIKSKDFNFSYSGLKTAVLYLLRDLKIEKMNPQLQKDIAASFQNAAIEVLIQKTIRAASINKIKTILLSGGVSANKLLRSRLHQAATENNFQYSQPPLEFTGDNGAMIAMAGYFKFMKNKKGAWEDIKMDANATL